ncbi:hypothetical protein [uncultured Tateyamaria sp.]|uniref:hypothetical protein n=1 Tax=uncultured Tateyamaria sp. TaxID=455651 RepID=UPI00261D8896|nr:hypothetical protein [uncultured Tateyamaria sp.]
MSDPMTNTEVEDVLASIRRLVSDDTRAEPEAKTAARSDRLVLTPALRVTEESDVTDTHSHDDDVADVEDVAAELEETAASASLDENSEDEAEHSEAEAIDEFELSHHDPALEASADSVGEETASSDAGDTEVEEHPITLDTVDLDQDTLMSIQDAFADVDDEVTAATPKGEEPTEQGASLSEKIAALETLIAGRTDEFEPETAGDGENAGTEPPTLEWEDAEEDVSLAAEEADDDVIEDIAPEETQIFSTDEDVLDEDALRDLVSDIVRQELQGALGERITRNVRKLVRREIHRALAAQELE